MYEQSLLQQASNVHMCIANHAIPGYQGLMEPLLTHKNIAD